MARTLIDVTQTFQEISTVPHITTIEQVGDGTLLINDAATDATAEKLSGSVSVGDQVKQSATVSTFARATGDGWKIIVDDD